MKKEPVIYTAKHIVSSLILIAALLWLTISVPFVYGSQQYFKEHKETKGPVKKTTTKETSNPFANSTEEKSPSSGINNLSEEYLHESNNRLHAVEIFLHHKNHHAVPEYTAFHGELICPPPEV